MSIRNPSRRYRRRTIRILVEYLCDSGPRTETATTLGAGGLFIESDNPPSEGSVLKVRFKVSPTGHSHEIEGCVAWSRGISTGHVGTPGMGIEFDDLTDEARTKINSLIRGLRAGPSSTDGSSGDS